MESFDVQENLEGLCSEKDYLTVYPQNDSDQLYYCNSNPPPYEFILEAYTKIEFSSDSDPGEQQYGGFEVRFETLLLYPTAMTGPCQWDTKNYLWISGNYVPGWICTITFDITVKLFQKTPFDVEGGGELCTNDRIIADGTNYCSTNPMEAAEIYVGRGEEIRFEANENGTGSFVIEILPYDHSSSVPSEFPSRAPSYAPSFTPSASPSMMPSEYIYTCICPGGVASEGDDCVADDDIVCTSCDNEYELTVDKHCVFKQCGCDGGFCCYGGRLSRIWK
eukprot:UN29191